MEAAIKALEMGKLAGVDNIPKELVQTGGEAIIDILNLQQDLEDKRIANHMDSIPSYHTPKKGNLQMCQNYRTIGLISHPRSCWR